ncbi:MAG: hypothetical protein Q8M76_00305, partial [Spirochaetaceae bacterium]|nr:hypothetical protein [Spirochaetaceae bacterium]
MAFGLLIDRRKLNKRNHVVDVFRSQGSLSKVRAREACGYSMDTLINVFDGLQEDGYILPAATGAATGAAPGVAEEPPAAPDTAPGQTAKQKRPKGRPAELF